MISLKTELRFLWPQSPHPATAPPLPVPSIPRRLLLPQVPLEETPQRPSCPWPSARMVYKPSSQIFADLNADCSLKPVRDEFETKIPELEANLSSVLGQPWKISFDPGHLYTLAEDRFSKEKPGQMFTQYMIPAPCLFPIPIPHKLTWPPTLKILSRRHQRHLRLHRTVRRRWKIRTQYSCLVPHHDPRADHESQNQLLGLRDQRRHASSRLP